MPVSKTSPDTRQAYPKNDRTIIQEYYSLNGDATAGQSSFTVYLSDKPVTVSGKFHYKINYLNFWTNDLNYTNTLGNRMDYPYLYIAGKYWTHYPIPQNDKIPLYIEEGYNELAVSQQWRVQNIELGRWKYPTPNSIPWIAVYYFNTNLVWYRILIEYEEIRPGNIYET